QCRGGTNKADTALCDDGNYCTVNDHCHNGNCVSGGNKANGTLCDDQNTCTTGETCQSGQCTSPTSFKAAGAACTDGNPCTTGNGTCSTAHVCQYNPSTQTTADGTACADGLECSPGQCRTGACTFRVNKNSGDACDSNSCTNMHCNDQLA